MINQQIFKVNPIKIDYNHQIINSVILKKIKSAGFSTINKIPFLRTIIQPKLRIAFLELTNKCNLRCKMCIYQQMQEKTGFMSQSLFKNCIDQLAEIGLESLNLHFGGESLLHPDFKSFLEYAINKRNQGQIGSVNWTDNGMLFNQNIADVVVDHKVDLINFSVDGIGEVNDNIRLGSNYEIIKKNIQYLLKKRGTSSKPAVKLLVVDCGKTEEQKLDIYREWVHLVDGIDLIPSILPDNTWENKENISKTYDMAPPPKFCPFPFDTIAISWNGKITGCCLDYIFKLDLGDVTKESIKQIWTGSKFKKLRKAVATNSSWNNSPCYKCEFWKVNFVPGKKRILNGKAEIGLGYIYRTIRKKSKET